MRKEKTQRRKRNHIAKIKNTTPKEKPQSRNKKQRKKRIHNAERVNTTPKEKTLRNQRLLESLGGHFTCTMKTSDERLKREGGETDVLVLFQQDMEGHMLARLALSICNGLYKEPKKSKCRIEDVPEAKHLKPKVCGTGEIVTVAQVFCSC
ncbi:hypothetical protein F2P81_002438 [Scophthalmus maximus]|uniref:Uncharacterized protein n=1 Tax=Scophthalmus maximus TaxID=52904 RepID=A0A6A4TM42_SCOMX|nr:hypothetical protein F2P81_002438 [Scophthalmus maximus]